MGGKRITIEYVRQKFEKEGYKLLTTDYIDAHKKLEYICPKNHRGSISWSAFQQGIRCAECAGKKKKDINFIRQEFEKEGYQLLTTNYINAQQKLEYICPKGHRSSITWSSWQQGTRCLECTGKKKKNIKFIRKGFEKEGYQLLTKKYKNNLQKLEYICSKGHKGSITWGSWSGGHRCAECYFVNNSGTNSCHWKNYTKAEIKQFKEYRKNVTQITDQNLKMYYNYINPKNLPRGHNKYHVDHIFTVIDGFNNKILPEVLASPINLQMLPAKENISKHGRSDMSKEILYELYYQFEEEIKETKI